MIQTAGAYDPAGGVGVGFRFESMSPFSGVHDPVLDKLLAEAQAPPGKPLNLKARCSYYDQAAEYIAKNYYGPFYFSLNPTNVSAKGIGGPGLTSALVRMRTIVVFPGAVTHPVPPEQRKPAKSAGFRHAICDLVDDLYVPGPMWLTVGDPASNGAEEAYRSTLAHAVPAVTDDHWFGRAVSGAGFIFAAGRLRGLTILDARPPGDDSRLNRIAALEAAADTAGRHHCLPQLTARARAAAENLRRRWPDADIDLTTLGDYTTRR